MQSVRKAEQAGALSGEMPSRSVRKTLRLHTFGNREVFGSKGARGERRKGEDISAGRTMREPGELENSREHVVPAQIKNLGAERGTAFRVGVSRWSAGVRPMWFYGKAQERKVRLETTSRSLGRNKALESEA